MKTIKRIDNLLAKLQGILPPYKIIGGFLFGVLLGIGILFYDRPFGAYSDKTWEFIKAPNTRYWFALEVLSLGLCGAIVLPLIEWIWSLKKALHDNTWKKLGGILFWLIAIVVLAYYPLTTVFSYRCDYQYVFPMSWRKSWWLGLSVYATLVLAAAGMLMVAYDARYLVARHGDANVVDHYGRLRENAFRLLAMFVINITLYPLTIRAKLNAISEYCDPRGYTRLDMYKGNPKVYLAYGAFFSLLLLLTYVPAYVSLHDTGRRLCDQLLPMPRVKTPEWDTWVEKRANLESILGVNRSLTESLLTVGTILVPFITGVYSFLTTK